MGDLLLPKGNDRESGVYSEALDLLDGHLNATRRLQAVRFYTDCYNERTYTRQGLEWVDKADLKTVILRHCPKLAETGLGNIKNAFEPWDTGERLAPERHPAARLRQGPAAGPVAGRRLKGVLPPRPAASTLARSP